MNSGRLKDKVTIQTRTTEPESFGLEEAWLPLVDCITRYARVIPLSTMSQQQWMQLNARVTHRVIMRGYIEVDVRNTRFVWKGRILTLAGVARHVEGSRKFSEFMCLESSEGMAVAGEPSPGNPNDI